MVYGTEEQKKQIPFGNDNKRATTLYSNSYVVLEMDNRYKLPPRAFIGTYHCDVRERIKCLIVGL